MKHISILMPEPEIIPNTVISAIGAYKMFRVVNEYYLHRKKKPPFKIVLAGHSRKVNLENGIFSMQADIHFKKIRRTDLIIVPPAALDQQTLQRNKIFESWIRAQHQQGAEVAGLCTGAFLMAAMGLLDQKVCSTHWAAADRFRVLFPGITLAADKVITDEQGIYTNGGAYSFLNLLLYLVEKYCGREVAIYCSKIGQIDMERNSQSPFRIFSCQRQHSDKAVMEAQYFIENNITGKISVDALAKKYGLSKRNFERRFKKATANTPIEYIQRVKIEYAKKNLETGQKNVSEVMYETGYSDRKTFRTVFKKITGLPPLQYQHKYTKITASL